MEKRHKLLLHIVKWFLIIQILGELIFNDYNLNWRLFLFFFVAVIIQYILYETKEEETYNLKNKKTKIKKLKNE